MWAKILIFYVTPLYRYINFQRLQKFTGQLLQEPVLLLLNLTNIIYLYGEFNDRR